MELVIITPNRIQTIEVSWMEANTLSGNRIIQPEHAPMLMVLQPNQPFIFAPVAGAEESITVASGTLQVERERALLLLHEE